MDIKAWGRWPEVEEATARKDSWGKGSKGSPGLLAPRSWDITVEEPWQVERKTSGIECTARTSRSLHLL